MMKELQHTRFRLSELVTAVQVIRGLPSKPSVKEALTYYWNWAYHRGWKVEAMSNQMDINTVIHSFENSNQMELRSEEYWNIVWAGEDVKGTCDILEESTTDFQDSLVVATQVLIRELQGRGWAEAIDDCLVRPGLGEISFLTIAQIAREFREELTSSSDLNRVISHIENNCASQVN